MIDIQQHKDIPDDDYKRICDELAYLEAERSFRIVYAVDAGSHSWGFAAPDSDYDVRFVYVRPISDYLKLETSRDVYEGVRPGGIDVVGWDMRKFLRLLRESNPSAIEWLCSENVFHEETSFYAVKRRKERFFDPVSSAWHYYGMAKKHDTQYLKGDLVHPKKYLHLTRAILACEWCISRFEPVPMAFETLANRLLLPQLEPDVENLLKMKRRTSDLEPIEHIQALDEWILARLDALPDEIKQFRHHDKLPWSEIDQIFLRQVSFGL